MTAETRTAGPDRTGLAILLRLALFLLAALLLVVPFAVAWRLLSPKVRSAQVDVGAATTAPSSIGRWYSIGAALPATAAPVVLAYHDVRPDSTDPYVVSPAQLDQELTALEAAGYRTLTSAEYADYLRTGVAPARSVYLTFDDGTEGLWEYADRILARHHAHGASFLITGQVGRAGHYYLTWDQVEKMAADGVWDFQAHTNLMHQKVTAGPDGKLAPALMNVLYDPATGTYESATAHRARISADLDALATALRTHGLAPALFFAYPFSETVAQSNAKDAAQMVEQLIAGRFLASFTNRVPDTSGYEGRQIQRYEVLASTTVDQLVQQVVDWTAVPPSNSGLTDAGRWTDFDGKLAANYRVLTGAEPARPGYTSTYFAPHGTASWTDYRLDGTVTGLARSTDTVSVLVRTTGRPVTIRISAKTVQIVVAAGQQPVRQATLPTPGADRTFAVSVTTTATTVTVDGKYTVSVPAAAGNTGGIALAVDHASAGPAPAFAGLTVAGIAKS